jgi:hypothetical protein
MLSAAKHLALVRAFHARTQTEILRCAQDDSEGLRMTVAGGLVLGWTRGSPLLLGGEGAADQRRNGYDVTAPYTKSRPISRSIRLRMGGCVENRLENISPEVSG